MRKSAEKLRKACHAAMGARDGEAFFKRTQGSLRRALKIDKAHQRMEKAVCAYMNVCHECGCPVRSLSFKGSVSGEPLTMKLRNWQDLKSK